MSPFVLVGVSGVCKDTTFDLCSRSSRSALELFELVPSTCEHQRQVAQIHPTLLSLRERYEVAGATGKLHIDSL